MLLTIRWSKAERAGTAMLGGEREREEEFWFGQGFAWIQEEGNDTALRLFLKVDVPRIVERTKRRDQDRRFSVGFCDSYPYTASGLMSVFLSRLRVPEDRTNVVRAQLLAYPETRFSGDIARRLFTPLSYDLDFQE